MVRLQVQSCYALFASGQSAGSTLLPASFTRQLPCLAILVELSDCAVALRNLWTVGDFDVTQKVLFVRSLVHVFQDIALCTDDCNSMQVVPAHSLLYAVIPVS